MPINRQATSEPEYTEAQGDIDFEFTPEQIKTARELQEKMPEALVSLSSTFFTQSGGNIMVTLRGYHPKEVVEQFAQTALYLEKTLGARIVRDERKTPSKQSASREESQPQEDGVLESGTSTLKKVVVDDEGHVEFSVGNFKYPFRDSRDPETIAALFDKEIGFEPQDFVGMHSYSPQQWGDNLVVDWAKVRKGEKSYYNVKRIRIGVEK